MLLSCLVPVLLLGTLLAGAEQGETVDLKVRLEPGGVYRFQRVSLEIQTVTLGEQAQRFDREITSDLRLEVREGEAQGPFKIGMTFERIRGVLEANGAHTTFDTAGEPSGAPDPSTLMQTALANRTIELVLGARGELRAVNGYHDAVLQALGPLAAEMVIPPEQLEASISDKSARSEYQGMFPILPEGAAAVGDTWSTRVGGEPPPPGQKDRAATAKLTAIDPDSVVIETTGSFRREGDETALGLRSSDVTLTARLLRSDGLPVSLRLEVKQAMNTPLQQGLALTEVHRTMTLQRLAETAPPQAEEPEKAPPAEQDD
ncbi:MAG: hypothetical protein HY812_20925 [Planctomycetes bacterium]|nr:hypothetical protein [Planctomycetota bacterium]